MVKQNWDVELHSLLWGMLFCESCQGLLIVVGFFFNGNLLSDTINELFCCFAECLGSK